MEKNKEKSNLQILKEASNGKWYYERYFIISAKENAKVNPNNPRKAGY